MPQIDFHILPDSDGRLLYTCRLAEKAYRRDHTVCILADNPQQADELDRLLWTFREGSFVPHERCEEGFDELTPVLITATLPLPRRDVLITLASVMPESLDAFDRMIEVVDQTPDILAGSRDRFRRYRQQGQSPEVIKL